MKYLDYYNYALKHSESELKNKHYEDVQNGKSEISVRQLVDICKRVYDKIYVLSEAQMKKICLNLDEYLSYYIDYLEEYGSFNYKERVIFTFCCLVYFRSVGDVEFCYDNSYLLKLANNKNYQEYIKNLVKNCLKK